MIALRQVNVRAGAFALTDISFEIQQGAYGVVLGPAGAGKTTLLEAIAGVVPTASGAILLGRQDVTRRPPERRGVGIVYQHAYLFPHLTVRQNIEYGTTDSEAAREVSDAFGASDLADRAVASLSGGERQLVALARTLARRPPVVLLDEPFSALDPRSRDAARRALRAIHDERHFTVLHVTHDFAEAGALGDTAIVLDRGRVVQQGGADEVFRHPASPRIADFFGTSEGG